MEITTLTEQASLFIPYIIDYVKDNLNFLIPLLIAICLISFIFSLIRHFINQSSELDPEDNTPLFK